MSWFIPYGSVDLANAVLKVAQAVEPAAWSDPPVTECEADIWRRLGRLLPECIGVDLCTARSRHGTCKGSALRWRIYCEAAYTMQQALQAERGHALCLDNLGRLKTIPGNFWGTQEAQDWLETGVAYLDTVAEIGDSYPTPIFLRDADIAAVIGFALGEPDSVPENDRPSIVATSVKGKRGPRGYDCSDAEGLCKSLLLKHGSPHLSNDALPTQAALEAKVSDFMSLKSKSGEKIPEEATVRRHVSRWMQELRDDRDSAKTKAHN